MRRRQQRGYNLFRQGVGTIALTGILYHVYRALTGFGIIRTFNKRVRPVRRESTTKLRGAWDTRVTYTIGNTGRQTSRHGTRRRNVGAITIVTTFWPRPRACDSGGRYHWWYQTNALRHITRAWGGTYARQRLLLRVRRLFNGFKRSDDRRGGRSPGHRHDRRAKMSR